MTSGILCVASAEVLKNSSTSGYFEYASRTTSAIFPVGNGPQKSAEVCNHGPSGVGDICNGSRFDLLTQAWQLAIFLSTNLFRGTRLLI